MFIQKIHKIAQDLGKEFSDLEECAREALLYGMNLTRTPGALKRAMKRIQDDSKQATSRWSGNAYLLHELPKSLTNKKCKIINLDDFLFAKKILIREHYTMLKKRLKNKPSDCTVHGLVERLAPVIRQKASGGRFLPQFDQMYENRKDIEQDLTDKALVIINKEFTNFNSHASEDISKYISCCLDAKAKTYVRSRAPRMKVVKVQDHQDMDRIMDENSEIEQDPIHHIEFKRDIGNFLTESQQKAVLLFLNMADEPLRVQFEEFLQVYGKTSYDLSQAHLKRYIAMFVGVDVFAMLKQNEELRQYLIEAV